MSEALGFKVEPRLREHQLAGPKEVERAIKEAAEGDEEEGGKGLGFGGFVGAVAGSGGDEVGERMMGYIVGEQGGLDGGGFQIGKKEKRRKRSRSRERRRRRGSIDRQGERDDDRKSHKRHGSRERRHHHHHQHHHRYRRSPSRSRSRSRQRGGERGREDDGNARRRGKRERSYSLAAAAQQQQLDLDRIRPPLSSRHISERAHSAQRRAAQSDDRPSPRSYRRERKDSPQLSDENAYSRHVRRERSYSPMKVRRRDKSRDDGNGDRERGR